MQSRSRRPYNCYRREERGGGGSQQQWGGRGFYAPTAEFPPSATDFHYHYEATTQSDTEAEEERAFWKRDRWQRQQMQQIQQQQKRRGGGIRRRGSLLVTASTPSDYHQTMMMRQNEAPFHVGFPTAFGGGTGIHQQNQKQIYRFPPYSYPHSKNNNQQQKNWKKGGEKQTTITMPWLQQTPPNLWCSTPKTSPSSPESSSSPTSSGTESVEEEEEENNTSQIASSGGDGGKSPESSSIGSETPKKKKRMDRQGESVTGKEGVGENIEKVPEKKEEDKENSFTGNDEDEDDDGGSVYFRPATTSKKETTTKTALGPLMNLNNLNNNGNNIGKKTGGSGRNKQKQQHQNRRPRPFQKHQAMIVGNNPPLVHQNPHYGYGRQATTFAPHSTFLHQPQPYFGGSGGYDFLDPPRSTILQQFNNNQNQFQQYPPLEQHSNSKHSKQSKHRRSIRRLLPPFDEAPESAVNNANIDAAIVSAPVVLDHRDHRLLLTAEQQKREQREQKNFFHFHNSSPVQRGAVTSRNRSRENAKDFLDVTYKNLIDLKLAETPPKNDENNGNKENLNQLATILPSGAEAITAITPSSTSSPDPHEFQRRLAAMAEESYGRLSSAKTGEKSHRNEGRDVAEETHFVNNEETEENENDCSREKPHYENILQFPKRPPPPPQWPMPAPPGAAFHHPVQPIEDGPEVYGRLVALSLLECAGPGQSEPVRRGVPVAQRQIEELLGIDPNHTESLVLDPAVVTDGQKNQKAAEFAHSCALFGSLVAANLRAAQALDDVLGRQHNGRLHRLHRILDRLKRGELVAAVGGGPNQKSGPFGAALLGKLRASGGRHSRLRTLWRRVAARIF